MLFHLRCWFISGWLRIKRLNDGGIFCATHQVQRDAHQRSIVIYVYVCACVSCLPSALLVSESIFSLIYWKPNHNRTRFTARFYWCGVGLRRLTISSCWWMAAGHCMRLQKIKNVFGLLSSHALFHTNFDVKKANLEQIKGFTTTKRSQLINHRGFWRYIHVS